MIRRRHNKPPQEVYPAVNLSGSLADLFAPPVFLYTDTHRAQQGATSHHALVNPDTKVIVTVFGAGALYIIIATQNGKPSPSLPLAKFSTLQEAVDCATKYLQS